MAELAFLGALIGAISTFGKMIYEEIKKAHDEARNKITETKKTIILVMNGEGCGGHRSRETRHWVVNDDLYNKKS